MKFPTSLGITIKLQIHTECLLADAVGRLVLEAFRQTQTMLVHCKAFHKLVHSVPMKFINDFSASAKLKERPAQFKFSQTDK